jgi:dihydroflavonol-4-reductase
MRALVTGAAGFLGSNVVRALLDRGYDVRALVRPESDLRNLAGLSIELSTGDVRDPASVRRALAGCPLVFHVAALYSFWVRPRQAIYATNVDGTRHVLQAAWDAGAERVVYTSSVASLGLRADGTSADETTPVDPRGPASDYKKSKCLGQEIALEFARRGLPVVIVNPTFPVGPYDTKPTPTGRVITDFLNRRMPAYVDTGMNVVAAEDVARGHLLAAEKGRKGECYILGGENVTMKRLLELLAEITGLPTPRVRLPYLPILGLSYASALGALVTRRTPRLTPTTVRLSLHPMYYDSRKAVEELGLPQTPAREALRRAVEWFWANGYAPPGPAEPPPRRS